MMGSYSVWVYLDLGRHHASILFMGLHKHCLVFAFDIYLDFYYFAQVEIIRGSR